MGEGGYPPWEGEGGYSPWEGGGYPPWEGGGYIPTMVGRGYPPPVYMPSYLTSLGTPYLHPLTVVR